MALEDLRGTLHFAMLYDPIAGILTVKLIEAQDLQPRDFSGTADPYAKVRLLPDASKINMWQTRIHKRTLNPGKIKLAHSYQETKLIEFFFFSF